MQEHAGANEATRAALDLEAAIDTSEAGEILGFATITLAQRRMRGEGPPFFRVGRSIRYRLGDVIAFRDAHTVGKPLTATAKSGGR